MRILCVDDDPNIRAVLEDAFFLESNIEVVVVETGLAALSLSQTSAWDIFVLDAEMPGLDGYGLCRRIRQNPKTAAIPVVFLTAKTKPTETERALELGATAWIAKPFDPRYIVADILEASGK